MELAQKAFHVPYFLKKIGICNISNKVMIQTGKKKESSTLHVREKSAGLQ